MKAKSAAAVIPGMRIRPGRSQFSRNIFRLIWEYRGYSLAILLVTILQEVSALWPVTLLGDFVDRLATGDLGRVVWLFLGASLLAPGIARGNVILRHKMFYETDFTKRVEMTLRVSAKVTSKDLEAVAATNTRVAQAVSGITNATFHVLGSFTPVIIKIAVVVISLIRYNSILGSAYLLSLSIPTLMTFAFNNALRVLQVAQYSITSEAEGVVMKAITDKENREEERRFRDIMRQKKDILITLVAKHQVFLYFREAALVGSQFLIVFIALAMRARLGLTPGDFTRLIGYTAQVAAAFINAAACLDAIISHSRAYHVYAQVHGE